MPSLKQPGRYKATVIEAGTGTAQTGTPYVFLLLRTDEGETCDAFLYLSDKAFERTIKTLHQSLGFDGQFETVGKQLPGRRCSITAEDEIDDNGQTRVRVRWINPEREPADASFLARLSERAAKLLGLPALPTPAQPTTAPAVAVKAAAQAAEAAVSHEGDDIPFLA